jgi:hypothetical protein
MKYSYVKISEFACCFTLIRNYHILCKNYTEQKSGCCPFLTHDTLIDPMEESVCHTVVPRKPQAKLISISYNLQADGNSNKRVFNSVLRLSLFRKFTATLLILILILTFLLTLLLIMFLFSEILISVSIKCYSVQSVGRDVNCKIRR